MHYKVPSCTQVAEKNTKSSGFMNPTFCPFLWDGLNSFSGMENYICQIPANPLAPKCPFHVIHSCHIVKLEKSEREWMRALRMKASDPFKNFQSVSNPHDIWIFVKNSPTQNHMLLISVPRSRDILYNYPNCSCNSDFVWTFLLKGICILYA